MSHENDVRTATVSGPDDGAREGKAMNRLLWTLQILLAALFIFSGVMKLVLPIADLTKQMAMNPFFLRFIGVAEVAGGLGLVLPWLLRIKPALTPIAAACLVIIMIGAIVVTLKTPKPAQALIPLVVGVLLVFVAWGRWRTRVAAAAPASALPRSA